ncbi:hypothetical protein J6590_086471 [Homalodisca vitripennis]|nr:hypothetical protein J6590_086471 [Homalodisca vitripennis]
MINLSAMVNMTSESAIAVTYCEKEVGVVNGSVVSSERRGTVAKDVKPEEKSSQLQLSFVLLLLVLSVGSLQNTERYFHRMARRGS